MTDNYERVRKQLEKIIAEGTDTWGTKKEINKIPEIIAEDENVIYFTSGLHASNNNTMTIILTDKRIIFFDKGMFISTTQFDIPLEMVNSIQYYSGLIFGRITIIHGASSEILENVNKETAKKFVELSNKEFQIYKKSKIQSEANQHAEALKSVLGNVGSTTVKSSNSFVKVGQKMINISSIMEYELKDENSLEITTSKLINNTSATYLLRFSSIEKRDEFLNKIH